MTWIAFYVGLSLTSAGVLWPMLRAPRAVITWAAPMLVAAEVPNATYDARGMT